MTQFIKAYLVYLSLGLLQHAQNFLYNSQINHKMIENTFQRYPVPIIYSDQVVHLFTMRPAIFPYNCFSNIEFQIIGYI